MKYLKFITMFFAGAMLILSCKKQIEEKQVNPNNPESVPAQQILGTILTDIAGTGSAGDLSSDAGDLGSINSWSNVQAWNQYHCQNYDYYGNNIYSWTGNNASFDPYLVIKNVQRMDSEYTVRGGAALNPYETIGRFIDAYYYYNLAMLFGDVPLTSALKGVADFTPTYTSQKDVFNFVLNELDTANTEMASIIASKNYSITSGQDIYYGGDLSKWQKAVNGFKLRVLIELSAKASDFNIPAQFAAIINNSSKYPVFTSQSDDLQFVYNPGASNTYSTYPFNPSNFGSIAQRFNMAATYVSLLTSLSDPRVFITCEPVPNLYDREFVLNGYSFDSSYTSKGTIFHCYKKTDSIAIKPKVEYDNNTPTQFKLFVGASTGEPLSTMYPNASAGKYSFINRKRYYSNFTGEPDVLVGYKELLFNIAEGIKRGWVSGNAENYYKNGITESMKFYGIDAVSEAFTAYFLPNGANSVDQVQPYPFSFDFANYYAQNSVKLSATQATAINQIVLQKYIAMFENSGYEGYYNWRRTGVPAFQSGSGVGNNGVIPVRWAYPVTEQTQNASNWKTAVSNQGFNADDLNQKTWLLK